MQFVSFACGVKKERKAKQDDEVDEVDEVGDAVDCEDWKRHPAGRLIPSDQMSVVVFDDDCLLHPYRPLVTHFRFFLFGGQTARQDPRPGQHSPKA